MPNSQLPITDIIVLVIYIIFVVGIGCAFAKRNNSAKQFMIAGGKIPGWAVGLSIFGTFLSSNTFIGVPGAAFADNWNKYVFSLSLPIAAFIAVRYFVPFYRRSGHISAYQHLEKQFGRWARTYAVIFYLLTQISRMGAIMVGVALALHALTGWDIYTIIIATGVLVTAYTLIGGIEAVIWTDVIQSIILIIGAITILIMLWFKMPDGATQIIEIASNADGGSKFSLGENSLDVTAATIWVTLLFGVFANLNNFGIDQSYVQRYHTAPSEKAAKNSVWLGALLYVPISLIFFIIGAQLFAYYTVFESEIEPVKAVVATEMLHSMHDSTNHNYQPTPQEIIDQIKKLKLSDYGDKVLPHFIVNELPTGFAGLIIAAIIAAAMSSIDTSLNSSSTVIHSDIYKGYFNQSPTESQSMRILRNSTILWGVVGTTVALLIANQKSLLDAWWTLSGIFAGGMLGLFLLGILAKKTTRLSGIIAVSIGLIVIAWMTFSPKIDNTYIPESPFHTHLIIVFGTATIIITGFITLWITNPKTSNE